VTLPRVTMAIDGRIALMTSRDAFDGVTVVAGVRIVWYRGEHYPR